MGFDTRIKESQEVYKERDLNKKMFIVGAVTIAFSVYEILTGGEGELADFLLSFAPYNFTHYTFLFFSQLGIILGIFGFFKGIKIPIVYIQNSKPKIYFKKIYEGKEKELDDFFYQAPIQTDELNRAKNVAFTKYTPKDFFKEDYENIINLFRGENFKEKERTFNDLIAIIEGVFEEYTKGTSRLYFTDDLPNPFKVKKLQNASPFKLEEGRVYLSVKQLIEIFDEFCARFERFIERNAKYRTRLNKIYVNELKKKQTRKKMMIYFKLVMFRRLFKLYMNIPSGWLVIRLKDYTARAIISVIDRESIVILDSRNVGKIKGFPDDRDTRMFLLLYNYFFQKSENIKFYTHLFELLKPDKTAKEIEDYILAHKDELENELIKLEGT